MQVLKEFANDANKMIQVETNVKNDLSQLDHIREYFPAKSKKSLSLVQNQIRTGHQLLVRDLKNLKRTLETYKTIQNPQNALFMEILSEFLSNISINERAITNAHDSFAAFISTLDDIETVKFIEEKIKISHKKFSSAADLKTFLNDIKEDISKSDISIIKNLTSFSAVVAKIFLYSIQKKNHKWNSRTL